MPASSHCPLWLRGRLPPEALLRIATGFKAGSSSARGWPPAGTGAADPRALTLHKELLPRPYYSGIGGPVWWGPPEPIDPVLPR